MNKSTVAQQAKTESFLPSAMSTNRVLQRKCACGNQTVAGGECAECGKKKLGLQRKLAIGASNDPLEREADRVADQVMAMSMSMSAPSATSKAPLRIQRYAGQASESAGNAPASVDRVLASSGRPLEPTLRQDMEQRFGHDFSQVRVHSGAAAEQSAREVNAKAYTVGNSIVFGAGKFMPGTHEGKNLVAHELTHVVQQRIINSSVLPTLIQRQVVEFEPEVITISESRRARILRRAGWRQTDVTIIARDFNGEPMIGRRIFAEFSAPGVDSVAEGADIRGGVVNLSNVWVKPSGAVRIMAISLGQARLLPQGVVFYRLPERGSLRFEATQRAREVTVTAATSQEAARSAGATGSVGIDFKVVSLGGEVSTESMTSEGRSASRSWKVTIPTSTFDINQVL